MSIRELTLGLVRPRELVRVLAKESGIGLINGIALGILLGGAAILWKGNPYLGLVVGVSLVANTLVAVSLGGLIPLILRGMRTDPALASGPLLTTVTDMCGFFFVLKLCFDASSQVDWIRGIEDKYLQKPCSLDELMEWLKDACKKKVMIRKKSKKEKWTIC